MRKRIFFPTIAAAILVGVSATGAADYSSWLYSKSIVVNPATAGIGATVANFPLLVRLTSGNFTFSQSLSANGGDLRFTAADGATDLSYQIERWDGTNSLAEIWVLVPSISNSMSTTVNMFWGKTSQTTTSSAASVFQTSNNFQAVWHMGGASAASDEADATANNYTAKQSGSPAAQQTAAGGGIGYSRGFNGTQALFGGSVNRNRDLKATVFVGSTGYAAGASGSIVKTTDAGVTWTEQTSGTTQTLNALSCVDAVSCVAVGANGTLVYTVDGGASWSVPVAAGNGTGTGITQQWLTVYVIGNLTTGTVYVGGVGTGASGTSPNGATTVRKATIAGGAWTWAATANLATNYTVRAITCSDASNCLVGAGEDANPRVNFTTNGGTSWTTSNNPSNFTNAPSSIALIGTVASGTVYITGAATANTSTALPLQKGTVANGVVTWGSSITAGVTVNLNSISCSDATHCIAVGAANGTVPAITATSNGTSWTAYTNTGGLTRQGMNSISCASSTNCFAVGALGTIINTANGTAWNPLTGLAGNFFTADNYTVSAWVKWASATGNTSGHQAIVYKNDNQYYIRTSASGANWTTGEYSGGYQEVVSTTAPLANDLGWHLAAVTKNRSANTLTEYVDGVAIGTNTTVNASGAQDKATDVGIGRMSESAARFWNGNIDEVVLSNATRSADWMKLCYQTQRGTVTAVTQGPTLAYTAGPSYNQGASITAITPAVLPSSPPITACSSSPSINSVTGLVLNNDCSISGAVSGSATVGATVYTVTGATANGTGSTLITITILSGSPVTTVTYSPASVTYGANVPVSNVPAYGGGGTPTTCTSTPAFAVPGLSLNGNCSITGTPTAAAAAQTYTVHASNAANGSSVDGAITLAVVDFSYSSNSAVYGKGVGIAANNPTANGWTPTSYSGTLPPGLALNTATGTITGTPTTSALAAKYAVTATDGTITAVDTLSITVAGFSYVTTSPIYGRGTAIAADNVTAVIGTPFHAFAVSPALPGLTLDTATGSISGTPTTAQPATAYAVTATNGTITASVTLNITVFGFAYSPASVTYPVNTAIAANAPVATGGAISAACASNPVLPAGLNINSGTCEITGTPTAVSPAANYTITGGNGSVTSTAVLNITVNSTAPTGLAYAVNPATYTLGIAIVPNTPSSTGPAPTHYSVGTSLPAGLSLDTNTGVVTGTPTAATAAANYVVTASNGAGSTNATLNITVSTTGIPPANLTYSANPATYGLNIAIAPNTPSSAGSAPSVYSVNPALPGGLSFNTTSGIITGTPTTAQAASSYTVTAANGIGSTFATLSIAILAAPTGLSYSANPVTYGVNVAVANNSPSVSGTVTGYSVNPGLPTGLSVNTSTGVISGTPATAQAATNYTVSAGNLAGSAATTLSIRVLATPSGLSYSAPTATYTVATAITPNLASVTGTVTRYQVAPALPAGLALDSVTGNITGTPSVETSAANYSVTASNVAGNTTATVNITILAANAIRPVYQNREFVLRMGAMVPLIFPLTMKAHGLRLELADLRGRVLWTKTLEFYGNGYAVKWDGISSHGEAVPAGLYLVRATLLDADKKPAGLLKRKIIFTP